MTSQLKLDRLAGRSLAEFGVARLRDQAFDAVQGLWRQRRDQGMTQKDLAEAIGRDPGWVSRNLGAPGNWTLRTIGEFVQALNGEVEITVAPLESRSEYPDNYDAYLVNNPAMGMVNRVANMDILPMGESSGPNIRVMTAPQISWTPVAGSASENKGASL